MTHAMKFNNDTKKNRYEAMKAAKAPKEQLRVSVYKTRNAEGKEIELPILQANSSTNVVATY